MKKSIVFVLLGSVFFTSCTTDDYNDQKEQLVAQENLSTLINRLVEKQQNQTASTQQKGTTSLQDLINQIETLALQDAAFMQLVSTNYTTPRHKQALLRL